MEPHGQRTWYLHRIPSYAKASEGYPPLAKSAEAAILEVMNHSGIIYAFIRGQSPWFLRRRITSLPPNADRREGGLKN